MLPFDNVTLRLLSYEMLLPYNLGLELTSEAAPEFCAMTSLRVPGGALGPLRSWGLLLPQIGVLPGQIVRMQQRVPA